MQWLRKYQATRCHPSLVLRPVQHPCCPFRRAKLRLAKASVFTPMRQLRCETTRLPEDNAKLPFRKRAILNRAATGVALFCMYRIKYCKVDTASTDSPFPKRCRAKLFPYRETKSIEWHSTLALCMKSEEQPIPGVAHQPRHPWRVVQTGKASLRKSLRLHPHAATALRQPPCETTRLPEDTTARPPFRMNPP